MIGARLRLRERQGGFALVMALMLMVLAVLIVTAYASMLQSAISASSTDSNQNGATSAAMAAIYRAAGYLINDTAGVVTYASNGIMISEVLSRAKNVSPINTTLSNSGFEIGPTVNPANWSETGTASGSGLDSYAKSGANAEQLSSLTTSYNGRGIRSDTIVVTAGETYTYGVSAARTGPNGPNIVNLVTTLNWFNASGSLIGATVAQVEQVDSFPPSPWVAYSYVAVAPVGAVKASLGFQAKQTGGGAACHLNLDDVVWQGPAGLSSDARTEFIEIQNTDSPTHNLVSELYWVAVGKTAAPSVPADVRYIHGLFGDSDSLAAYEVGVIVAVDADTTWIAQLVDLPSDSIHWFGLSDASGVGPATDTMLGPMSNRTLADSGDSIILGFGNVVSAPPWYGTPFPDSIPIGVDSYSWQKKSPYVLDDTEVAYSTFYTDNWDTRPATPGIAFSPGGGNVDGATTSDILWYRMMGDSFVQLSPGIYYRARVYDEAGKINVNAIRAHNTGIDSAFREMLMQEPPYGLVSGVFDKPGALHFSDGLIGVKPVFGTDSAYVYTPEGMFLVADAGITNKWLPYMTPYGYARTDSEKININMAETPVMRGAMIWALAPSLTQAKCEIVADKIYMYLTNPSNPTSPDYDPSNDAWYNTIDEVGSKTLGLTATERGAIFTNLTRMKQIFRVASSQYFTIVAAGFVFKSGANLATDTPIARSVITAVIRRDGTLKKGDIVFWREIYEDPTTRYAIGTFRYRNYPWDPTY